MIDFGHSQATWTSRPYVPHPHYVNDGGMRQGASAVRDVRHLIEATCTLTSRATAHVEEIFLLHSCLAEFTIPKRDFFVLPSYQYRALLSRTHSIPIARRLLAEREDRKAEPFGYADLKLTMRTFRQAERLTTARQAIEATLAGKPLNARTTYRDDREGWTVTLEYPVRTMNLSVEEDLFQVDTGELALPDMATWDGQRVSRAFIAHVAFSQFDSAEFILRREVEPADTEKLWLHVPPPDGWRWELQDQRDPAPGHPPRMPWPTTFNDTVTLTVANEFWSAEIG
ncbi:MAG: hypothetical protein FJ029_14755 [Actinobacteria bacterium]|nr:hypothetical protein [Actinomycetota bacterium]